MSRGDRAAALVAERELDLLLVSNLVNVRYLSGFTGTNGVCLIGDGHAYSSPTSAMSRGRSTRVPTSSWCEQDLLEQVAEVVREQAGDGARVGFDDTHVTGRRSASAADRGPSAGREAGGRGRPRGAVAGGEGRRGAEADAQGGRDHRRPLPLAHRRAWAGRPHGGRGCARTRAASPGRGRRRGRVRR